MKLCCQHISPFDTKCWICFFNENDIGPLKEHVYLHSKSSLRILNKTEGHFNSNGIMNLKNICDRKKKLFTSKLEDRIWNDWLSSYQNETSVNSIKVSCIINTTDALCKADLPVKTLSVHNLIKSKRQRKWNIQFLLQIIFCLLIAIASSSARGFQTKVAQTQIRSLGYIRS